MSQEFDQALDGVDDSRRSFLKKMAVTTAFVAPVVSSFTMTGIKAVYAQTPRVSGPVSGGSTGTTSTTGKSTSTTTPSSSTTSTTNPNSTTTTSSTTTSTTTTSTTTTTTTTNPNSTSPG